MKTISIKALWDRYRRRKSVLGIVSDFVFLAFIIALLFPSARQLLSATVIRIAMFQPKNTEEVIYLTPEDLSWRAVSLNNDTVSLQLPADKPILINFWATWCPPCIAELPSLQRLYNQYHTQVDFYFISDEDPQTLRAFLLKKGYTIPVYTIQNSVQGKLYSRSIPASFLIAPNGRLIMNKTGAAKWDGERVKKNIDISIQNR